MKPKIVESGQGAPNKRYARFLPKKDVALILDEVDECTIVLPVVMDHLEAKRRRAFFRGRGRILDRIAEVEAFQVKVSAEDGAGLSFELTPREAEAAHQRLEASANQGQSTIEGTTSEIQLQTAIYISQCLGIGWSEICAASSYEQLSPELPAAA